MSDGRQVLSELRANMVDVVSYLVPGGTLLLLLLYVGCPSLRTLRGWQAVDGLGLVDSGWLSFVAFLVVLGAAYVLGTLLKTIDSWCGPKFSDVLPEAVREMQHVESKLRAAVVGEWGLGKEEAAHLQDNVRLHNVADVLVRGYAPGMLLSWQERHEWLQNLYGGLAWALWVGTAAIVIDALRRPASLEWSDSWLLVCALPAVRWRLHAWWPDLGKNKHEDDDENAWRWIDGLLAALVLGLSLFFAIRGWWYLLAVLAAAALGDALKRRQWSVRAKAYNIMWHGALLVLRPVAGEPETEDPAE